MSETRMRAPNGHEYLPMRCRCCDAESVLLVLDLGDQPLCNRLVKPETPIGAEPVYPLRLGYCESCTLLQIDHTIPRDDMFREYVYVSGTTQTLADHFAATTRTLRAIYGIRSEDLVVDIGSNDGTWLKTWGEKQRAVGVEPATDIAKMARNSGIDTMNRYFDLRTAEFILANRGPAKLITSAGSFFHMEDLHGACEGIRTLLDDDGVFVCQAISANDMIRGNAFDQVLHEHLCSYTPISFGKLMRLHGLELDRPVHLSIHGGTWEYHVRKVSRTPLEHGMEFSAISFAECRAFAARVLALREDVLVTLHAYKAAGKRVWAYGAPGKGGTLLNSFGIGPDLVECATEKNPLKFGLSIPGCRVPIVPEDSGRPDAYLVLAWNFLDEFLVKERDWLDAGGEFIVPVPRVRIIKGDGR